MNKIIPYLVIWKNFFENFILILTGNSTNESSVFQPSPTTPCTTYINHIQPVVHNYQPTNQPSQFSWLLTSTGPQAVSTTGFTSPENDQSYPQQVNQQFHENVSSYVIVHMTSSIMTFQNLPPLVINQPLQQQQQQQQSTTTTFYSYNENCFENLP